MNEQFPLELPDLLKNDSWETNLANISYALSV